MNPGLPPLSPSPHLIALHRRLAGTGALEDLERLWHQRVAGALGEVALGAQRRRFLRDRDVDELIERDAFGLRELARLFQQRRRKSEGKVALPHDPDSNRAADSALSPMFPGFCVRDCDTCHNHIELHSYYCYSWQRDRRARSRARSGARSRGKRAWMPVLQGDTRAGELVNNKEN